MTSPASLYIVFVIPIINNVYMILSKITIQFEVETVDIEHQCYASHIRPCSAIHVDLKNLSFKSVILIYPLKNAPGYALQPGHAMS